MWVILHSNNVWKSGNDFIFDTKKDALKAVRKASGDVVPCLQTIEEGFIKFGYGRNTYYIVHKSVFFKDQHKHNSFIWEFVENKQDQINKELRGEYAEYV
jgi:hypothetical protein